MLAFALGLSAGTAALRPALPAGGAPGERVEVKLDHLRRHGERYDTLFVGSSRTFRGFVPSSFDAATAAAGMPTHSFNLGVPGSRATEVWRLLERVAELRPGGWRTVFVDPEGFEVLLDEGNHLARSVIDWHDLETTLLITDYIREREPDTARGPEVTRARLRLHAVSCAYNLAGIGRALPWVDEVLGITADPEWVDETLGPERDGYAPQDRELRRGFKRDREEYEARVEDLVAQDAEPHGEAARQPLRVFARIQRLIESLGARPVFVAQPGMFVNHDLARAAEEGVIGELLRFDQPLRFPDLYAFEARFDFNHLNALGAERFTRHLAEAYVELERRSAPVGDQQGRAQ